MESRYPCRPGSRHAWRHDIRAGLGVDTYGVTLSVRAREKTRMESRYLCRLGGRHAWSHDIRAGQGVDTHGVTLSVQARE